ncbi:MAG: HAMP domain-containing sensor histidine kinase [Nitrospirota bacterium]
MFKFPSSIRRKIRLGYGLFFIVIITGILFVSGNLKMIERKILLSNVISELFETTLEIRRFEKNYFLYKENKNYLEILHFIGKAEDLINANKKSFKGLASMDALTDFERILAEYRKIILDNKSALITDQALEEEVRNKGKELVTVAEDISSVERGRIQALLSRSRHYVIVSMVIITIIVIVFGYMLMQSIVKPLKSLEETMLKISGGNMERVSIDSSDREIASLNEAFNRMLSELEARQVKLISKSDKLASLGTMISGVAHQLNNPLSNISSSCQILQEEIEEPDVAYKKELLEQIDGQVERAKTMVRSLLEFARKKEFKKKPCSLRDMIADTLRLVQGDIPTHVEIVTDLPENNWVPADKQRLQQAILNIVKNCIDAIVDEGKITITAREVVDNGTVEIRIQDTGIGIGDEYIGKVFEPFFTTKEEGKGSGLGLFVAREIIEEHGGNIQVKSRTGEGTTFIIRLPLEES